MKIYEMQNERWEGARFAKRSRLMPIVVGLIVMGVVGYVLAHVLLDTPELDEESHDIAYTRPQE
jgi:hypothetical protein